ncbi:hypothetical protein [Clostridium beijerinckii]|nr:hypothetical protein [Clostridium beijerinckii]
MLELNKNSDIPINDLEDFVTVTVVIREILSDISLRLKVVLF